MLLSSWETFENYTSPFGLGAVVTNCKVNPAYCPDGFDVDFYSPSGKFDHYWLNLSLWQYALKQCDRDPATGASTNCTGNAGYGGGFNASRDQVGNNRSLAYGATYCGSNAAAFASPRTTPRRLLTFHHLPWNDTDWRGSSGSGSSSDSGGGGVALLQAIEEAYRWGVAGAAGFVRTWTSLRRSRNSATRAFASTDPRYGQVLKRLATAADDARNFSDAALGFFAAYHP